MDVSKGSRAMRSSSPIRRLRRMPKRARVTSRMRTAVPRRPPSSNARLCFRRKLLIRWIRLPEGPSFVRMAEPNRRLRYINLAAEPLFVLGQHFPDFRAGSLTDRALRREFPAVVAGVEPARGALPEF